MNYIGSKYSLLDFLETSIRQTVNENCKVFCDLFAGTGGVGTHFKRIGYQIVANDLQYYSYVLNRHYIGNDKPLPFDGIKGEVPQLRNSAADFYPHSVCSYLSSLEGIDTGFMYNNYAPTGSLKNGIQRQFFTDENAKKCDAVRQKIEQWNKNKTITDDEYFFLLTSLLESIDARANTASVYGAFLKKIKNSAKKPLQIKPAVLVESGGGHSVYNQDINKLIQNIRGDILYLDPPYNHRQYSANYHILETIAKNDAPDITGVAGLRNDHAKSLYCGKTKAKQAFQDVIRHAEFKYIFVSYNNEGIIPLEEMREILGQRGEYGCFTQKYKRFQADTETNRMIHGTETVEYLHYVKIR